jgi:hypothetical protein
MTDARNDIGSLTAVVPRTPRLTTEDEALLEAVVAGLQRLCGRRWTAEDRKAMRGVVLVESAFRARRSARNPVTRVLGPT